MRREDKQGNIVSSQIGRAWRERKNQPMFIYFHSIFTLIIKLAAISPTIRHIFTHLLSYCFTIQQASSSIRELKTKLLIEAISGNVMMSKQEATGKKVTLKWTENMDNAFIEAMMTQKDSGNRINGNFSSTAYDNMTLELSTKFQTDVTKQHLKNRLKTLKEHFSQWYDMFHGAALSGFSWNSTTQLIEAEDEVWSKLIESKPEAEALKTKRVSNFYEMLELFGKDRASGSQAETAKERNARFQKTNNINLETVPEVDEFCAANDVILESQYNIDDDIQVLHPTSSLHDQSSSAKKCKSRKRKIEQENEDLASMIMNSVGSVANAIGIF